MLPSAYHHLTLILAKNGARKTPLGKACNETLGKGELRVPLACLPGSGVAGIYKMLKEAF